MIAEPKRKDLKTSSKRNDSDIRWEKATQRTRRNDSSSRKVVFRAKRAAVVGDGPDSGADSANLQSHLRFVQANPTASAEQWIGSFAR